jgi:hypothetical protein
MPRRKNFSVNATGYTSSSTTFFLSSMIVSILDAQALSVTVELAHSGPGSLFPQPKSPKMGSMGIYGSIENAISAKWPDNT